MPKQPPPTPGSLIAVEFVHGPADGAKEIRRGTVALTLDPSLPASVQKNGQTYALTEVRVYLGQNSGSKAIYTPTTPHT